MIARKSFLIVMFRYLSRFIGWIGLITIAKFWGNFAPEALGTIAFAMSLIAMFDVLSDLGFSKAHIKRISEGKDLGTCIGTFAATRLLFSLIMVSVLFASIFILETFFNNEISDASTKSVIYIMAVYYVFLNLQKVALSTFQGTKEIVKRQIVMLFENIVKVPLMIIVVFAGVGVAAISISPVMQWPSFLQPLQTYISQHALGSLAMAYLLGILGSFAVGLFFLRKYPLKKPSFEMFKSYFYFAVPVMMLSIISRISLNVDKIMIGYFWTATEVGYYFTVQRVLEIILVISGAVGIILFPTFSEHHVKNNFENIRKIAYKADRYISMSTIPFVVMTIVFVEPVIKIMLSNSFLPAASALVILSIYAYTTSIRTVYSSLIIGINRPLTYAKIGIAMFSINIILNYLFIPKDGLLSSFNIYGPTGAAIATASSGLFGLCGLRFAAKKHAGVKLFNLFTFSHIFAGVVTAGVLYFIKTLFMDIHIYHLISFGLLGLVVYTFVLYLIKEFKKQDLMFFLDILHPKKMIKYMSSELKNKNDK